MSPSSSVLPAAHSRPRECSEAASFVVNMIVMLSEYDSRIQGCVCECLYVTLDCTPRTKRGNSFLTKHSISKDCETLILHDWCSYDGHNSESFSLKPLFHLTFPPSFFLFCNRTSHSSGGEICFNQFTYTSLVLCARLISGEERERERERERLSLCCHVVRECVSRSCSFISSIPLIRPPAPCCTSCCTSFEPLCPTHKKKRV